MLANVAIAIVKQFLSSADRNIALSVGEAGVRRHGGDGKHRTGPDIVIEKPVHMGLGCFTDCMRRNSEQC